MLKTKNRRNISTPALKL